MQLTLWCCNYFMAKCHLLAHRRKSLSLGQWTMLIREILFLFTIYQTVCYHQYSYFSFLFVFSSITLPQSFCFMIKMIKSVINQSFKIFIIILDFANFSIPQFHFIPFHFYHTKVIIHQFWLIHFFLLISGNFFLSLSHFLSLSLSKSVKCL